MARYLRPKEAHKTGKHDTFCIVLVQKTVILLASIILKIMKFNKKHNMAQDLLTEKSDTRPALVQIAS